jgi:hypothetical protein
MLYGELDMTGENHDIFIIFSRCGKFLDPSRSSSCDFHKVI